MVDLDDSLAGEVSDVEEILPGQAPLTQRDGPCAEAAADLARYRDDPSPVWTAC
jgi:hypothetical protein